MQHFRNDSNSWGLTTPLQDSAGRQIQIRHHEDKAVEIYTNLFGEVELVPFLHQLVSPTDEAEIVNPVEFVGYKLSKKPTSTTWAHGPCSAVFGV